MLKKICAWCGISLHQVLQWIFHFHYKQEIECRTSVRKHGNKLEYNLQKQKKKKVTVYHINTEYKIISNN